MNRTRSDGVEWLALMAFGPFPKNEHPKARPTGRDLLATKALNPRSRETSALSFA